MEWAINKGNQPCAVAVQAQLCGRYFSGYLISFYVGTLAACSWARGKDATGFTRSRVGNDAVIEEGVCPQSAVVSCSAGPGPAAEHLNMQK